MLRATWILFLAHVRRTFLSRRALLCAGLVLLPVGVAFLIAVGLAGPEARPALLGGVVLLELGAPGERRASGLLAAGLGAALGTLVSPEGPGLAVGGLELLALPAALVLGLGLALGPPRAPLPARLGAAGLLAGLAGLTLLAPRPAPAAALALDRPDEPDDQPAGNGVQQGNLENVAAAQFGKQSHSGILPQQPLAPIQAGADPRERRADRQRARD